MHPLESQCGRHCWLSAHYPFLLSSFLTKHQYPFWGPRCPVIYLFSELLLLLEIVKGLSVVHSFAPRSSSICHKASFAFLIEGGTKLSLIASYYIYIYFFFFECGKELFCNLTKTQRTKEDAEKNTKNLILCWHFS